MAAIAGKDGKAQLSSNDIANVVNWSLDVGIDMADITALGDEWKENLPTLSEWSGSLECSFDQADTNGQVALRTAALAKTQITVNLYVNATNYYSGSAYVSSLGVETPVDDKVSMSVELTGDGALTYN